MAFVWQNRAFDVRQLGKSIVDTHLGECQNEKRHKPDPGEQCGTPMAQSVVSIVVSIVVLFNVRLYYT